MTVPAKTATCLGILLTLSRRSHLSQNADVYPNSAHQKATRTVLPTKVRLVPQVFAISPLVAPPAFGAGPLTIQKSLLLLRLCIDANLQKHPSRSVTTALICTINYVKPTAKNASGRGPRLIRLHGSLLRLPAAANPPTLLKLSGVTTALTLTIKSVAPTAKSVAGHGMLPTQISGPVRVPLADAETGGSDFCLKIKNLGDCC